MHYHVETNTLICHIKRLGETHLEGFSLHQLLPETRLLESSLLNIDISLTTIYILQVSIQNQL